MSGTYRNRRLMLNGRAATVIEDYWDNGNFEFAVIRYLDKSVPGATIQVIRGLKNLEECLLPDDPDEETDDRTATEVKSQEGEVGGDGETSEPNSVPKRSENNIALPIYGSTDARYVLSPTGKWIPREVAREESDMALSVWIDLEYPPLSVWPVQYIVDDRINEDGKQEFLIKFRGYELNPGVKGDPSNPGDWYLKEEDVDPFDIREYRKKKARGAI